jgi:hypothetical protein
MNFQMMRSVEPFITQATRERFLSLEKYKITLGLDLEQRKFYRKHCFLSKQDIFI